MLNYIIRYIVPALLLLHNLFILYLFINKYILYEILCPKVATHIGLYTTQFECRPRSISSNLSGFD